MNKPSYTDCNTIKNYFEETNLAIREGVVCEPHAVGSLKIRIMMIDNDKNGQVLNVFGMDHRENISEKDLSESDSEKDPNKTKS